MPMADVSKRAKIDVEGVVEHAEEEAAFLMPSSLFPQSKKQLKNLRQLLPMLLLVEAAVDAAAVVEPLVVMPMVPLVVVAADVEAAVALPVAMLMVRDAVDAAAVAELLVAIAKAAVVPLVMAKVADVAAVVVAVRHAAIVTVVLAVDAALLVGLAAVPVAVLKVGLSQSSTFTTQMIFRPSESDHRSGPKVHSVNVMTH